MLRILVFVLATLVVGVSSAEPCVVAHGEHHTDPNEQRIDRTPPSRLDAKLLKVTVAPWDGPGRWSSCDDLVKVDIQLSHLHDDRTSARRMGFRIVVLDGVPPENFHVPEEVWAQVAPKDTKPVISLVWVEFTSQPFDFTLGIKAVDLAGNESRDYAAVRVRRPGDK